MTFPRGDCQPAIVVSQVYIPLFGESEDASLIFTSARAKFIGRNESWGFSPEFPEFLSRLENHAAAVRAADLAQWLCDPSKWPL